MGTNPPFLVNFCFFNDTLLFLQSCVCWKHYKIVFSAEHSFCASQSKPLSRPHSQNGTFPAKSAFWVFLESAETLIFVVFGDFVWSQERTIFLKQIVWTKMHTFYLLNTKSVLHIFLKHTILAKKAVLCRNPQNTIFLFFWNISFPCVFIFSLCFLQHTKDNNQTSIFFFSKTLFDTPTTC